MDAAIQRLAERIRAHAALPADGREPLRIRAGGTKDFYGNAPRGEWLDPRELRFHTVWSAVRLYGLIMQARAALTQGIVNDVEITFACADNIMLLFLGLAQELQAADAL